MQIRIANYLLISHSIKQRPSSEANRYLASQEIPCILWYPKVHYRINKTSPLVSIQSQINPVHVLPSYFLEIHFNITIPSTSRSSKCSPSLRFSQQNPVCTSPLLITCHKLRPSRFSLFDYPNNIRWLLQIMKPLTVDSLSVPCCLVTLRPKYLPQYPILKHPRSTFLPQCERLTHNNRQNYSSVLTNLSACKLYCGNSHRNESM
jgi:hypothetical protein